MRLYEISNIYQASIDRVLFEEADANTISEIKDDFNNKSINVAKYIKNLEAEFNAVKEAEDGMAERRKALNKRIDSLKSYLQNSIEETGLLDPIKCPEFTIKLQQNPP